ncbi:MAG: TlyA family RNA methyltransferase [Deltaproteobacteria bacterium]|nr:TlyA family RNA methyltransferase [Deltaproteobacteria bacterium]
MNHKKRLDILIVEKGFAGSRERAKAVIMAGSVIVNGIRIDKPGKEVDEDAVVSIKEDLPYVSRGGIKLEGALKQFDIDVHGLEVMDVGASTGGFTDCLLKMGAKDIFAVDVGKGLIDWKIRNDKRVKVIEGRNIRYLEFDDVGILLDMAVIDVSFISLQKVIPKVMGFVKEGGSILALIKPQFEVGKGMVGKGGIVRDIKMHQTVIDGIRAFAISIGLDVKGVCESPISGAKGNREFWIYLKKNLAFR